jgi:hypothetical protein
MLGSSSPLGHPPNYGNRLRLIGDLSVCSDKYHQRLKDLNAPTSWKSLLREPLEDDADDIPEQTIVDTIEECAQAFDWDLATWGNIAEAIAPEIYAEPKEPKKACQSQPGTPRKILRIRRRARYGLSLWHPGDPTFRPEENADPQTP